MSLEQIAFDRLNQKCDSSYTDISYLEEYGKIVALYKISMERSKTGDRNISYELDDILKTINDNTIYFIAEERLKKKMDSSYTDISYLEEYGKIVALYKILIERKKSGTRDANYDYKQILSDLNNDIIGHIAADRVKQKADSSYTDFSYLDEYLKVFELYNLEVNNIKKNSNVEENKTR